GLARGWQRPVEQVGHGIKLLSDYLNCRRTEDFSGAPNPALPRGKVPRAMHKNGTAAKAGSAGFSNRGWHPPCLLCRGAASTLWWRLLCGALRRLRGWVGFTVMKGPYYVHNR